MKLGYACTNLTRRSSAWAICCGSAAIACFICVFICVALAILPSSWVGHPYLDFVEFLNPGVDAPDNWALAATYFMRAFLVLMISGLALLFIGNPYFWVQLIKEACGLHEKKVN